MCGWREGEQQKVSRGVSWGRNHNLGWMGELVKIFVIRVMSEDFLAYKGYVQICIWRGFLYMLRML